jgi:serine/threonine-protein kinase
VQIGQTSVFLHRAAPYRTGFEEGMRERAADHAMAFGRCATVSATTMDPERWNRIRQVYETAADLTGDARERALREACAGDETLLHDVRELLALDAGGAASAADRTVAAAVVSLIGDTPGDRIGPYRVVDVLGHGGMGTVYLADRVDGGFEQRVALKVIKPGLDSDQLLRRFHEERQILARLQHPHIARLLDGGIDGDGRPYFALECVEGVPITRYCDSGGLEIDARLALFLAACEAVSYAHASLVVHRDLKPAHILVTASGDVRLLDFGIAKVLGPDGPTDASLTTIGLRAFSPDYASPEQVRGEPVGTATDVYSLGVILYELLTGVRPFDLDGRSQAEIERIVCGTEPERPSTKATRATGARPDARPGSSAGAGAVTGRFRSAHRLRGDLDQICLKALQKDPARRYRSVEALAEDLRRHRAGLPVTARPDSLAYRSRRFVGRHRYAVAAGAVAILLASGFATYHTTRLARERDRAALEAAKAREVAQFLVELFETSDPGEAKGRTITARELLDAGAARLENRLAAAPRIQASLLRVIGDVYRRLGLTGDARPLLERALAQDRRLHGADHEETADSAAALGAVLQDAGDVEAAEPLLRESLAIRQRRLGPAHAAIVESLELLAFLRETRGDVAEAERLNREALVMSRALWPAGHPRVAHAAAELGGLLRRQRRFDEAEPLLREALAAQRRRLGDRDLSVASTQRNLAALLRDRGDLDEADLLLREVIATRRTILGADHRDVAVALGSHAGLLQRRGDLAGAIDGYREFLRIAEAAHQGRPHPDVAAGCHNLAEALHRAGRLDEAAALYRRAIAEVDAALATGHANRAHARAGLAALAMERGDHAAAEPLLREALAIRRAALPAGHRHIGETLLQLGACLTGLGRFDEAERDLREAAALFTDGPAPDDGRARRAAAQLEHVYAASGRTPPERRAGATP